jgi:CheY-like chemotaxis protein/HEAT repeat protein
MIGMPENFELHLIEELRYNIVKHDLIKARVLMRSLSDAGSAVQHRVLFELSRSPVSFTVPLLACLSTGEVPLNFAWKDINDLLRTKINASPGEVTELLTGNPHLAGREYIFPVLAEAKPAGFGRFLIGQLESENDAGIRIVIINSLAVLQYAAAAPLIARMAHDFPAQLAGAATEALAAVGSELSLLLLNRMLNSSHSTLRNTAKQTMAGLGGDVVGLLADNLTDEENTDLVINSLDVLGEIGGAEAGKAIRRLIHRHPADANVRFSAYEALARTPIDSGAHVLAGGLNDPIEQVRIAAAAAIEKNANPLLIQGLRNLTKQVSGESDQIIHAILAAGCTSLFQTLASDQQFSSRAAILIEHSGSKQVRDEFMPLLVNGDSAPEKDTGINPDSARIIVVDDSKLMLRMYRTVFEATGFNVSYFENPLSGLDAISSADPQLLITDLNMPGMDGTKLAGLAREQKKELPILMVTTQNEGTDEIVRDGLVDLLLPKPFSANDLLKSVRSLLATHA